ncbi:MAG: DUF1549 domain-containing protein [Planctomycetaceae bacterium]|nr:DUF1549 domain-containing protein [Planctomycetaceae bacterium]
MPARFPIAAFLATIVSSVLVGPPAHSDGDNPAALEYFEKQVRPLLVARCYNCHSADTKPAGQLRVDDRNGLLVGGDHGAAIIPGDPDASLLIAAVAQTHEDIKMPAEGDKLSDDQIAVLRQWIADGAVWPGTESSAELLDIPAEYEDARRSHWAFQPLQHPAVPDVRHSDWPRSDVDRFILAKLEETGLSPVDDAEPVTLLRRVTFDLTGLPPAPEEIAAFAAAPTPEAFAQIVDRLLDSPAFGEHWGRHWLDIARYGESTGSARNVPYPHAWRYRNYVIDALNADKPYDEFVREQIAGDLLPAADDAERREHLVATGFLALGVKDVNQRFKVRFEMDNIDEQIDTVSRSLLALTVSCARCHDHKFDPVSTRDYYALAGIFQSTELCAGVRSKMGGGGLDYYDTSKLLILTPGTPADADSELQAKIAETEKAVAEAKTEFERLRDSPEGAELAENGKPKRQQARQKLRKLEGELTTLTDPVSYSEVALGVRESATISDTEVRLRGEAEQLGPVAPRGFPHVLSYEGQPAVPADQSGRLQLAEWLSSPNNPLPARVIANRVWQHLFGAGLVTTVDNFGTTGDTPSHPELLDHLAQSFIDDGWSLKRLVRSLVLTRAYQLDSAATDKHLAADPANRRVWRHSPRRLSAEELRDTMLVAAGVLDRSRPDAAVAELPVVEIRNNGPEAQRLVETGAASVHRSVYLPLLRTLVPDSLEVFDFAEQGLVTGSRQTTTVPPQALYLLNDPFVRRQSLRLAEQIVQDTQLTPAVRVQQAYRATLARDANAAEIERVLAYVAEYEQAVAAEQQPVEVAAAESEVTVTAATTDAGKPITPVNPDDVPQSDAGSEPEMVNASDPQTAAWASFVQALLASGEFRYLR